MMTEIEEKFLLESNKIEGILRPLRPAEKEAYERFMALTSLRVEDIEAYVRAIQPDAALRDKKGIDVRVGNHLPPKGGPEIRAVLSVLLDRINKGLINSYDAHIEYETIHPFLDGNGRSGRMIWWWMTSGSKLGFLHKWYYQSLDNSNHRKKG